MPSIKSRWSSFRFSSESQIGQVSGMDHIRLTIGESVHDWEIVIVQGQRPCHCKIPETRPVESFLIIIDHTRTPVTENSQVISLSFRDGHQPLEIQVGIPYAWTQGHRQLIDSRHWSVLTTDATGRRALMPHVVMNLAVAAVWTYLLGVTVKRDAPEPENLSSCFCHRFG